MSTTLRSDWDAPRSPVTRSEIMGACEVLLHAGYHVEGLAVLHSLLPDAARREVVERLQGLPLARLV